MAEVEVEFEKDGIVVFVGFVQIAVEDFGVSTCFVVVVVVVVVVDDVDDAFAENECALLAVHDLILIDVVGNFGKNAADSFVDYVVVDFVKFEVAFVLGFADAECLVYVVGFEIEAEYHQDEQNESYFEYLYCGFVCFDLYFGFAFVAYFI
jgi:hypothetical protein